MVSPRADEVKLISTHIKRVSRMVCVFYNNPVSMCRRTMVLAAGGDGPLSTCIAESYEPCILLALLLLLLLLLPVLILLISLSKLSITPLFEFGERCVRELRLLLPCIPPRAEGYNSWEASV